MKMVLLEDAESVFDEAFARIVGTARNSAISSLIIAALMSAVCLGDPSFVCIAAAAFAAGSCCAYSIVWWALR